MRCVYISVKKKDTVDDAASLNVSILRKVELDELPKATGVIVVHSLGIPKGFHDGAEDNQANEVILCVPAPLLHDLKVCPVIHIHSCNPYGNR